MLSFLTTLKSKLLLILGAVTGFLLLYIGAMKRAALERKLKRQEARSEYKDKAVDALIKGIEDENKPVNRGYFDDPRLRK